MAAARENPRVFTVPPGVPFLPTLADTLLSGALIPLAATDPLALAGVTVLLPTRRSVRAFADALVDRLGGEAAILPAIRPIGDVDEEDHLLDPLAETGEDRLALPPAIDPLTRRLALTRLTLGWAKAVARHPLGLKAGQPMLIPASAGDAVRLAGDLARLLDDMATAEISWEKLRSLVPDDHAEYFGLTLDFLRIVSEAWPHYLADNRRVDRATRRDSLIRAAAARLERHGSPGPVIAAGSTGSIPATAALLRAVARLENGAVVLPGLDQDLDAAGWAAIGDAPDAPPASHGHPQFGLRQLIAAIGVAREAVAPLGHAPAASAARARLLSSSIRPASTLDAWAGVRPEPDALAGVDLVVARNEREEAVAIALAIRETVETPGATAALVTPDRMLARRVAVELGRWGLAIDDSAGARLDREPHGVFARLVVEAAASEGDAVKLLALLKHPLSAFGMARPACRQAARILELALFRGHRVPGGVTRLAAALTAAREKAKTDRHVSAARRRLDSRQWEEAVKLVERIAACLGPLEALLLAGAPIPVTEAAAHLADALASAASDDTGTAAPLGQGPGGEALATLLAGLAGDGEAAALALTPADFPFFLAALLGEVSVQRVPGADPRIHIWGALEARLQSADLLVLGGLDEGVWPVVTRTDPWLSRAMRAAVGLPPPERRLGLSAHDFFQGLAAPRVIVTRAEKRGGTPMVESRWLQRLRALIGDAEARRLAARGDRFVGWARDLDRVGGTPAPILRPAPTPPLAARPSTLSITEIETLIRDPYAIYARRILKLEPLEPIGRLPDGGLRGTLMHEALGRFTGAWAGRYDAAAEEHLLAVGREVLAAIGEFPDVHAVWSIRFAAIAGWFTAFEAARDAAVARRHAEIDGKIDVPAGAGIFTLRGRADRVDEMKDGRIAIYDFKTSTPQTERTVFAGLTPQMTLEAAMVRGGGFPGIAPGRSVAELAWLAIGKIGRDEPYVSAVAKNGKETADELADRALVLFAALVGAFADPAYPYKSRTRPRMEHARYQGDYDHLARVREWALVESPEDVAAMGGPAP